MSKVVIVGTDCVGKTSYLYGMLKKMIVGYQGFYIRVVTENAEAVKRGIKRLSDTKLPFSERLLPATLRQEEYKMDLFYNLNKIDTLHCADYPGEWHYLNGEWRNDFVKLLEGADCLLLCVNGEAIQGSEDDIDGIAALVFREGGGFEIAQTLLQAEAKYENGFPPVCIMIMKYDRVSPALCNMRSLIEIMTRCFPMLFCKGNGLTKMVTICPVTLGKEFWGGGELDPKNVEKPICFASYLAQTRLFAALTLQVVTANISTEERRQALKESLNVKNNCDALRSVIEELPLFINGQEAEWPKPEQGAF